MVAGSLKKAVKTIFVSLNWFITRLALCLLYYFVFTPISAVSRLFGISFLDLRFDPDADSYWISKKTGKNKIVLLESCSYASLLTLRRYRDVYAHSGYVKGAKKLPSDFMNQVDICSADHRAGKVIDWVYSRYVEKGEADVLCSIMKDDRAHLIIKKTILKALGQLYYSFVIAEKFAEKYGPAAKIDFIPNVFSYSLYDILSKKDGALPANIHVPGWYVKQMKWREFLKNLVYRAAFVLYPLALLFRMSLARRAKKERKHFSYGLHLWDSKLSSANPPYHMDFLHGEDAVTRDNTLYVVEEKLSEENYEKLKRSGYNYCYFKEMIRKFSVWRYLSETYPESLKVIRLMSAGCKYNSKFLLTKSYLKTIRWFVLLEIFNCDYEVDLFVVVQSPGIEAQVLIQNRHNSKSIYICTSTTMGPLYREDKTILADTNLTCMVNDAMVSSPMTVDYFKSNGNYFKKYEYCGVIPSDVVFQVKCNAELKAKIRKDLGVPENMYAIGFFDTKMGAGGILTSEEGYRMLRDINSFIESNEKYFIIYKSRGCKRLINGSLVKKEFDKLVLHKRVIHFESIPFNYTPWHIMGASDLVIGAYTSSVPLESVAGGVKTVCYLPSKRFDEKSFIINSFPRFCVRGYEELKECAEYWLHQCKENEFLDFQNNYIKKYVDGYCDGQASSRVRKILREYNQASH